MCESTSSVAGRLGEGSGSSETMAAIREPDVARRGQKSEESTHKPEEEKIWVSRQPSSNEEESEEGSEEEAGGRVNNGTVLVLPLEGWELPEQVGDEDRAPPPKIQGTVSLLPGGMSRRESEGSRGPGGGIEDLSGRNTLF